MASRLMTGSANGSTKVEPILGSDLRNIRKQYGAGSQEYKTATAVQQPSNVQQPKFLRAIFKGGPIDHVSVTGS